MKISAVIIAFNEEENIGACIDSLTEVADEIIVVDSFSSDNTEKICAEKKVKFIKHKFEGYIQQKKFALNQAENNYVLSLDADERLSNELKKEILKKKENLVCDAYLINRLNNFCGKWIKYGVWYPDKKIRLWNKVKGIWGGTNPHDKVIMDDNATLEVLGGNILHYTVLTREQYQKQMEKFSDIAAQSMKLEGKKSSLLKAYSSGVFAFVRSYIFRLGFLDGSEGFEIAKGYSGYTRMKYLKMLK